MEIIKECVLVAIFVLLTIACCSVVAGLSYIYYHICEGREITIKMEQEEQEEQDK